MGTGRSQYSRIALGALRLFALEVVIVFGWYLVGTFRTQQIGFSIATLFVTALLIAPVAVIPFVGLRWRSVVAGTAAVWLLTVLSVEMFAHAEESRFLRDYRSLPPAAASVFENRQWPFSDHYMCYDPATKQCSGGD